jgi:hypothetical protein
VQRGAEEDLAESSSPVEKKAAGPAQKPKKTAVFNFEEAIFKSPVAAAFSVELSAQGSEFLAKIRVVRRQKSIVSKTRAGSAR